MASFSDTKITPANGQKIPTVDGSTTGYTETQDIKDYILASKAQPNGIATLDENGKLPSTQLPDLANDVLSFDSYSLLPSVGADGVLYIVKDTNKLYRWDGTSYVSVSADTSELEQRVDTLEDEVSTLKSENRVQSIKIENLEALAEGKIKVDHTEDTENGTLDLPSGKLAPYAEVEKVMGKSVAWNQLATNTPFSSRNGITTSTDGNYCIINGTVSSTTNATGWWNMYKGGMGAKYNTTDVFMIGSVIVGGSYSGTVRFGFYDESSSTVLGESVCRKLTNADSISFFKALQGTVFNNLKLLVYFVDLTTLFGVTETSQVTESMKAWVCDYAEAHPQYNTGEVLDSTPTEVKSVFTDLSNEKALVVGMELKSMVCKSSSTTHANQIYIKGIAENATFVYANRVYLTGTVVNILNSRGYTVMVNGVVKTGQAVLSSGDVVTFSRPVKLDRVADVADLVSAQATSILTLPSLTLKQGDVYDPKTGEVTETYGKYTFNGSETWGGGNGNYYQFSGLASVVKKIGNGEYAKMVSTVPVVRAFDDLYTGAVANGIAVSDAGSIRIGTETYANRANLGSIVFELAIPTTRQETPLAEPFLEVEAGGTISVVSEGAQADATIHYQSQLGGTT